MIGVYAVGLPSGRMYIGSSGNITRRFDAHRYMLRAAAKGPSTITAEGRAKMSAAKKGRVQTPEHVAARMAGLARAKMLKALL